MRAISLELLYRVRVYSSLLDGFRIESSFVSHHSRHLEGIVASFLWKQVCECKHAVTIMPQKARPRLEKRRPRHWTCSWSGLVHLFDALDVLIKSETSKTKTLQQNEVKRKY